MTRVPMPEPNYNGDRAVQRYRNNELVPAFGEATVIAAEQATALDIIMMMGLAKPREVIELIKIQCEKADYARRRQANLEEDKG